jgi:hypothetical protein
VISGGGGGEDSNKGWSRVTGVAGAVDTDPCVCETTGGADVDIDDVSGVDSTCGKSEKGNASGFIIEDSLRGCVLTISFDEALRDLDFFCVAADGF